MPCCSRPRWRRSRTICQPRRRTSRSPRHYVPAHRQQRQRKDTSRPPHLPHPHPLPPPRTVDATDTSPRHAHTHIVQNAQAAPHPQCPHPKVGHGSSEPWQHAQICARCMRQRGGGEAEPSPPGGSSVAARRQPHMPHHQRQAEQCAYCETRRPLRRVRGAAHPIHDGGVDERANQRGRCLVAHVHDGQGVGAIAYHVSVRAAHRNIKCLTQAAATAQLHKSAAASATPIHCHLP